jgi:hypothetical protein
MTSTSRARRPTTTGRWAGRGDRGLALRRVASTTSRARARETHGGRRSGPRCWRESWPGGRRCSTAPSRATTPPTSPPRCHTGRPWPSTAATRLTPRRGSSSTAGCGACSASPTRHVPHRHGLAGRPRAAGQARRRRLPAGPPCATRVRAPPPPPPPSGPRDRPRTLAGHGRDAQPRALGLAGIPMPGARQGGGGL